MQKEIHLKVCQGVGDIFWVYQKFAPHVDVIDFSICQVDGKFSKVGTRAVSFLKLLPKVRNVDAYQDTHENYQKMINDVVPMSSIIPQLPIQTSFSYACNKPLEEGIRIEDIDPDYSLEETVNIYTQYCPLVFNPGEYIVVYVSGTTSDENLCKQLSLWTVAGNWFKFIRGFLKHYNLDCPIMIVGANYDQKVAIELEMLLKKSGYQAYTYIDAEASNITYILKNSICFIGYQSGLNVLADNLDVKQIMLYFPYLRKMLNSWCKLKNWKNGNFNAFTFDMNHEQVLSGIRFKL